MYCFYSMIEVDLMTVCIDPVEERGRLGLSSTDNSQVVFSTPVNVQCQPGLLFKDLHLISVTRNGTYPVPVVPSHHYQPQLVRFSF